MKLQVEKRTPQEVETNNIFTISQNELERDAWVESMISAMNLKQKLGQFFMVDLWPMEGEASITMLFNPLKTITLEALSFLKAIRIRCLMSLIEAKMQHLFLCW